MEENKENTEYEEIEGKKFWNKYGFLVIVVGFVGIFIVLKLIGFPDFLYK